MAQAINDPLHWQNRRDQWMARVEGFIKEVEAWATTQGWAVARTARTVNESALGQYTVPLLRVRLPVGEVHVIPVGLHVIGADGRIDLEAFPSLNRVKIINRGGQWKIYTDSNVALPQPWNQETFVQLANDLLA